MQVASGQVAVITGAASGIGLAMARAFAARGLKLVLADIDRAGIDGAVTELGGAGAEVIGETVDVSRAEDMERLRDRALARFGRVDIVCNNAGIAATFRPIWEVAAADWERMVGINLWGVIHGVRLFVPLMVGQGAGHVVNTASMAGVMVVPSNGPYNATKHAVVSISETLRADLERAGHAGVGVTVICPGLVATNINKAVEGAEKKPVPAGAVVLEADDVARQVIAAIEADQLYVATNPGSLPPIRARVERLLSEVAAPL
jgi:NADP-dependent 3-hydroxy acid dehydrogenase YdfG